VRFAYPIWWLVTVNHLSNAYQFPCLLQRRHILYYIQYTKILVTYLMPRVVYEQSIINFVWLNIHNIGLQTVVASSQYDLMFLYVWIDLRTLVQVIPFSFFFFSPSPQFICYCFTSVYYEDNYKLLFEGKFQTSCEILLAFVASSFVWNIDNLNIWYWPWCNKLNEY
jgi:hypothetical protein